MPLSTRLIKSRIKSVTSTRQITRAMEAVSASKMSKAVNLVLASRPYSEEAWGLLNNIALIKKYRTMHPLLKDNKSTKKQLILIIASDKGLCAGFNTQVFKQLSDDNYALSDFIAIGKKAIDYLAQEKVNMIASFEDLSNNLSKAKITNSVYSPSISDIRPIAKMIIDNYIKEKYNKVLLIYTDYVSALKQIPRTLQILPIKKQDKELGFVREKHGIEKNIFTQSTVDYLFEPSISSVLDIMLPRLVEAQIYQAILESSASEHSARMIAMKNATSSASDLIEDLLLTFNRVRQSGITSEIAEISGARMVMQE